MHPPPPSRRFRLAAVLAALGLVLLLGLWISRQRTEIVFEGESRFGRVWVEERADGLRSLFTGEGRARQSAVYPGRPRHLELAYTRVAAVGLALAPEDGRLLYVGLGGGAMPMYARAVLPDARVDVVEIDPLIVEVARSHFGFRTDSLLAVHTGDGRAFLEQVPAGSYDLIVLDAFSDDQVPAALTTRQFLQAVCAALAPGGVVLSNLWSGGSAYQPMVATYRAVFDDVRLVRVAGRAQRILIAGTGENPLRRDRLVRASRALSRRADLGFDLPALVAAGYENPPASGAPVLEDQPAGTRLDGMP